MFENSSIISDPSLNKGGFRLASLFLVAPSLLHAILSILLG